jgi:hypothetical protein
MNIYNFEYWWQGTEKMTIIIIIIGKTAFFNDNLPWKILQDLRELHNLVSTSLAFAKIFFFYRAKS